MFNDGKYTTLLFNESPIIGSVLLIITITATLLNYYITAFIFAVLFIFMAFFYRHIPLTTRHKDNIIVSPADGTITNLRVVDGYIYISIFLSPLNIHTQTYPVNGTVIKRIYDKTGKFGLATTIDKCRHNEKKMHFIKMQGVPGVLQLTQIAGFLPRRITSDNSCPVQVSANEYLGMIKFGSRVDILFPANKRFNLRVRKGQRIRPGELIGHFI